MVVKIVEKIKITKMNHEALPAPNSMTRFALEALSEGKQ